jgi:hypothetical protein
MLKRQIAIPVFAPVLIQLMAVGIMLHQVLGEIAFIVMLVRMVIVMREQLRQFQELFCKGIIAEKLQQEKYGCEFFH